MREAGSAPWRAGGQHGEYAPLPGGELDAQLRSYPCHDSYLTLVRSRHRWIITGSGCEGWQLEDRPYFCP